MTVTTLDRLPSLVLELICESLVQDDDDDDRVALYSFALANKACFAAATPQRFNSIVLWPSAANRSPHLVVRSGFRQQYDIRRWIKLLDQHNGWRYIRRLRISHGPEDLANKQWDSQHDIDVDSFLQPLRTGNKPNNFQDIIGYPNFVDLLTAFLSRATGLQDLVWTCHRIAPRIIELLATQLPRCRLHMHQFQLESLWMPREKIPQPISDEDWALVTSPNLYTVVARLRIFDRSGHICYLEPAVKAMVGGVTPNLRHVSLERGLVKDSPRLREAIRLGRPQWAGFHPTPARHEDSQVAHHREDAPREVGKSGRGALRSLVFRHSASYEDMLRYGELTDLTTLRHLTPKKIGGHVPPLPTLASQARAGEFRNLTSFCLRDMDVAGGGLSALNEFLENVGRLQHLCLSGFVGNDSFDIILRRHGKTLRSLHLDPYGYFPENDEHKLSKLLEMSAADVQHMAEACPNLTEIEIPVLRSHADAREVAVYRALSRLRHLKRAWLYLEYWVGPDGNASYNIAEEDMYLTRLDRDDVMLTHLKDAIVDCAIDETLARSIFDTISGGADTSSTSASKATGPSSFRWLRLDVRRRKGRFGTPGEGSYHFDGLIELFMRDWVVERRNEPHDDASHAGSSPQDASRINITELNPERAREAADEWKDEEEWNHDLRQNFKTAFEELWHPDMSKSEWWNDWRSFPLRVSSDST